MGEKDYLLSPQESSFDKIKRILGGRNVLLAVYLFLLIIFGTSNRVSFKIMQNATFNYAYFDSQFTTLVFVVVSAAAIFVRILTGSITKEMRQYPKYKFAIMGLFDSLAGLVVTVGGMKVSGMMQALLLQGAVPMTMLFSLLILRPSGCDQCKKARNTLLGYGIRFTEISTLPQTCTRDTCLSRVTVNGVHMASYDMEGPFMEFRGKSGRVTLEMSSSTWEKHLKTYYTIAQYLGAIVVLGGLGISLSGSLKGAGGDFLFEMISYY